MCPLYLPLQPLKIAIPPANLIVGLLIEVATTGGLVEMGGHKQGRGSGGNMFMNMYLHVFVSCYLATKISKAHISKLKW